MPGLNIATILSYVLAVAVGVLIYFVYAKLNISKANVSAQKIIDDAKRHGANLMVVACPMCHTNLDMRQTIMKRVFPEYKEFPVLYLTELLGLALGMDEKELGIYLHTVKFNYNELAAEKATV